MMALSPARCRVLQLFAAATVVMACSAALADDGPSTGGAASGFAGTKAGQVRIDGGLKAKFVWITPGHFTMGSPGDETDRRDNEKQVDVQITTGFWLGQTEVTQSIWTRVMQTTPWKGRLSVKEGADYAATYVSWDDAMAFCKRLTELERSAGELPADWKTMLPTEAQWEYACRAGTRTRFSFGSDDKALVDHGWFDKNTTDPGDPDASKLARRMRAGPGQRYAHQVAQKSPNPWGLYDMHGNAAEWCRDTYLKDRSGGDDPCVSAPGALRVIRGGNWVLGPKFCRSANRDWSEPDQGSSSVGFRIAIVRATN